MEAIYTVVCQCSYGFHSQRNLDIAPYILELLNAHFLHTVPFLLVRISFCHTLIWFLCLEMGHSGATQLLDVVGIVATTRTGLHLSWMLSCTYETWLSTDGWGFGSWSGNREGRVRLIGSDSSNCTGLSLSSCRVQIHTSMYSQECNTSYGYGMSQKYTMDPHHISYSIYIFVTKLHCCTVHFWALIPLPHSHLQILPSKIHPGARSKRTQPRRGWSWASSAPVIPSCGCTRQAETSSGARPGSNSGWWSTLR